MTDDILRHKVTGFIEAMRDHLQKILLGAWFGGMLLTGITLQAQETRFPVRHLHWIRDCQGEIIFGEAGVEFKAANKKHSHQWRYEEIQQLGLLGPKDLSIVTYEDSRWKFGKDQIFRFELTGGEITPALQAMLQEKLTRPIVTAVLPKETAPKFIIPVKHERGFIGTQGLLEITDEYILYRTDAPKDSRMWRYQNISSIGSTGPYQLRLTSFDRVAGEIGGERNFVFSLKRQLEPAAYDFIWWKINGSKIYPPAHK